MSTPRGPSTGGPSQTLESDASRIQAPPNSTSCLIGAGIKCRYAYVSQRGYYPDEPNKANQDAFNIVRDFLSDGSWFFGVFDGHGKEGDLCAQYAKRNLANSMGRAARNVLSEGAGPNSRKNLESAMISAHISCNSGMHSDQSVDDSLSGTTAVSITFWGDDLMTVCNVGDSRAVVGVAEGKGIKAYPLSHDQTPYRKDERIRVKKCGARILSLDQIEGLDAIHENWGDVNLGEELDEGGDPPRIWHPQGEYPGTAFTRSLGDTYAEELGVFAEPEVITRRVSEEDKIVVIASDGVFEFLTNQSVIDMCCKFKDPLEACRAVVAESYELWLQYELRTDDITMIAIFLDEVGKGKGKGDRGVDVKDIAIEGIRPVRRQPSRQKKKAMMKARSAADDADFDMQQYISPKSDHEKARIHEAIKASFLFQHISPSSRELLFSVMEKVKVKKGDWIIRQGEEGDRFYIVDNGRFEVRIQEESKLNNNTDGGKLVHVYRSGNGSHPSFGELALMYSTPRAASIIADSPGQLWALHRNVFRKVLMRRSGRKELVHTLRKIELFKCLNVQQVQSLADIMTEVQYEAGETIVKQGGSGDSFYVIRSGNCVKSSKKVMRNTQETLGESDYFGETALLSQEARSYSVVTSQNVKLATVDRGTFESKIGNLSNMIEEDKKRRDERSFALSGAGPPLESISKHGAIVVDDISMTVACEAGGKFGTLRIVYKEETVKLKQEESTMREMDLLKTLSKSSAFSNCSCLPTLQSTYTDIHCLYALYEEATSCSVANLVDDFEGMWDESCVKHVAMCILLGLEAIHSQGVVFRGISPEHLLLTMEGNVILTDFHYARQNPEGNVTICGAPEYLAPEVVQQQGHGLPSDFWTMGIVLYELFQNETPFFAPNEVDVYAKICRHTRGGLEKGLKEGSPLKGAGLAKCLKFLNKTMDPDPANRGKGATDLKKDSWFTTSEWKKLSCPKIRDIAKSHSAERLAAEDESTSKFQEYRGKNDWCKGW